MNQQPRKPHAAGTIKNAPLATATVPDIEIPRLSVITVTLNNLHNLKTTVDSVSRLSRSEIEYWVIDGASDDGTREYLSSPDQNWLEWLSEPDAGLYEAMNKGLDRVSGDYVVFINAGDTIVSDFSWMRFLAESNSETDRILVGRTIETYQGTRYLRPGIGKDDLAMDSPPHQATFYPRSFFAAERLRLDRPLAADIEYTKRGLRKHGGVFVPQSVCEFQLGGLSSSYGSLAVFKTRWKESAKWPATSSALNRTKLLIKAIGWRLLPRHIFYRLLSIGKYTVLD